MDDKKRFNGREMDALMHLQAAQYALEASAALQEKLKKTGCWSMIKGAAGMVKKSLDAITEEMPAHQRASHSRNCHAMEYGIKVKRPAKNRNEDGVWLSYVAIDAIVDATKTHCITCMKDPQQMRSCPLQKALDELPMNLADFNNRNCPYFGGF